MMPGSWLLCLVELGLTDAHGMRCLRSKALRSLLKLDNLSASPPWQGQGHNHTRFNFWNPWCLFSWCSSVVWLHSRWPPAANSSARASPGSSVPVWSETWVSVTMDIDVPLWFCNHVIEVLIELWWELIIPLQRQPAQLDPLALWRVMTLGKDTDWWSELSSYPWDELSPSFLFLWKLLSPQHRMFDKGTQGSFF